jgi:hypothetical protein
LPLAHASFLEIALPAILGSFKVPAGWLCGHRNPSRRRFAIGAMLTEFD